MKLYQEMKLLIVGLNGQDLALGAAELGLGGAGGTLGRAPVHLKTDINRWPKSSIPNTFSVLPP